LEAELIILGMHREEAFNDLFRGTTAERVIRVGNLPVLLVKERMTHPYRRVTVGVDFSVYSRRAMEFAVGLVPKAEFCLVHAYHVPFKGILRDRRIKKEIAKEQENQMTRMVEQEMASFLGSLGSNAPELERIIKEGTPQEVIGRQIDRLGSDLLVVGTHGRTGMAHAILGSVAENYLRQPPCDVLAVQAF
jgi:nucleotide-binding universal stress UspA family protein